MKLKLFFSLIGFFLAFSIKAQQISRKDISLNDNWVSIADDKNIQAYQGFQYEAFKTLEWEKINVPHNWDKYEGYQRKLHGNRHGYAWYRKTFKIQEIGHQKRFFIYFEGVGSYATIWLNGMKVGSHAGGRTTFTIDVSSAIKLNGQSNLLAVRADHPANIQDLPWVDGGCSTERGFSEGSQPMGIFRPVHLMITDEVRVQPFGVHVWNDNQISEQAATLNLATTVKNYGSAPKTITVVNQLVDQGRKVVKELKYTSRISPGKEVVVEQGTGVIPNPHLWSLEDPYLYTIQTKIFVGTKLVDEIATPYGIRWISWPIGDVKNKQFLLNGKPVFINGIAEYEHLIGNSHAFTAAQIRSRVMQIKSAGFNAFRDAHQPHHLDYQKYWDRLGILSWTQMAAHIWYDTPAFRKNFKELLIDWVKERRNSPSVVLWGLENESTLPEDFAKECTELIRKLDPTASSQRKVTTCNGGKGTDWDVPQNWTGTYGGNPLTYAEDLKRQVLVGEYGAWRTIDLHQTDSLNKGYSENQMTALMETKVRLAETVKDQVAGHYFWLYSSHDNPGRVQGGEGLRDLDRVGPVNYKGMFTPWEEPIDVYYMFRSNYAPKKTEPMVYIVSHTWPNRWNKPGIKDSILVYSNCDEVALFNDIDGKSLGKKSKRGVGTHFQWDQVNVAYNVLYAVGYVDGKPVARDTVILNHLPEAPNFNKLKGDGKIIAAKENYHYVYRVNCGGPDYIDSNHNLWVADRQLTSKNTFGSNSWTKDFPGMPAFFASQRRTFDPIKGTQDWKLFQTFRYGRDKLNYHFPLPDGQYLVELYFIEPWLGTGGGLDATAMRLFDVAFNGLTVLKDVDIWKSVGHDAVLKKSIMATVKGGSLDISFPKVKVGQALISAIAIASLKAEIKPAQQSEGLILESSELTIADWMDIGDNQFADGKTVFASLPSNLYGATYVRPISKKKQLNFKLQAAADVFVGVLESTVGAERWLKDYENTKTYILNSEGQKFVVFRKRFVKGANVTIGSSINLGDYIVALLASTNLAPAYDLKNTVSYKATDAILTGEKIKKAELMGRARVVFQGGINDKLTFLMAVGVADTYSLTIKYHNPSIQNIKAKLEFLANDGTIMKTEELTFAPTKEGKWNYLTTNTGSMVNAGSYKVSISGISAPNLYIDALDVQ
jgi:beta-galactosidase